VRASDRLAFVGCLSAALCLAVPTAVRADSVTVHDSLEIAGYLATAPAGPVMRVHAQLTAPAFDCSGGGEFDLAVRVVSTGDQASTDLYGYCPGGTPTYSATGFQNEFPMTISPGDTVALTIRVDTRRKVDGQKATIDDLTTGVSMSRLESYHLGTLESAFIGNSVGEPVNPPFGQVRWVKAVVNAGAIGDLDPRRFRMIEHPLRPRALIWTSPLTASGDSFKTTWAAEGAP
jgi:hypothetical protein